LPDPEDAFDDQLLDALGRHIGNTPRDSGFCIHFHTGMTTLGRLG
jgi:hypothetical protein